MATRIYVVSDDEKPIALVRAASRAAALRVALGERFDATIANQEQLIALLPTMAIVDDEAKDDELPLQEAG
jgi:leucyl aminopeptidase